MQWKFLGTAGSQGVPVVGCRCAQCTNPKNPFRMRSALLCTTAVTTLIDVGPDIRMQLLRYQIEALDAVLVTHVHYDHIVGLNDLKPLAYHADRVLPVYADSVHRPLLQKHFPYLESAEPWMEWRWIEGDQVRIGDQTWSLCRYHQGTMPVLGLRCNAHCYLTDIGEYPIELWDFIAGAQRLVLSATNRVRTPNHLTLKEACAMKMLSGVEKCYLTHLDHTIDINAPLPAGCYYAYDGCTIT